VTALLAAERIKLFSTRSPWWCCGLAVVLVAGMTGLLAAVSERPVPVGAAGSFLQFGLVIVMVMAAVSVTTEYRFSTIRLTFQAVPNRVVALLAKTAVVTVVAAVVGLVASFGAWAVLWVIRPSSALAATTAEQWRGLAGPALVFAVAAVLAVAVGILVRQTAAAVTILLVWTLLLENLVVIIPNVGPDIQRWLPFVNLDNFLGSGREGLPFGPWGSLVYVVVLAAALLAVALAVANRRDA